jgi:hypothetical protein
MPRDPTVLPSDAPNVSSIDANTAVEDRELVRLEGDGFFEEAPDASLFDAAAHSHSSAVRVRALSALSARHVAGSVEWLAAAVTDPDPWVSNVAGTLITESSDPRASDSVLDLLRDSDPARRWRALRLLEVRPKADSRPWRNCRRARHTFGPPGTTRRDYCRRNQETPHLHTSHPRTSLRQAASRNRVRRNGHRGGPAESPNHSAHAGERSVRDS